VVSITSDGIVDAVNDSYARQTGYACAALIGQRLADMFPSTAGTDTAGVAEQLRLTERDGWHLDELWQVRKDGSRYWCQRLIAARAGHDGQLSGYTMVLRDIARQSYDTDDLRRLLTQDHLTGAANRARFQQVFEREHLARSKHGAPLSLIMLDIDHFKAVNDSYGHLTGDLVLCRFAETIAKVIRPGDLLARLGGEEFAALLPATDLAEATALAEHMRSLVADMRIATPLGELTITVSLGCATARPDEDLLGAADQALYIAKRTGRNRVHAMDRSVAAA
jgi:diguanylate cyclase (GGDEF)-like protein/PAS domain S-box-containing protein